MHEVAMHQMANTAAALTTLDFEASMEPRVRGQADACCKNCARRTLDRSVTRHANTDVGQRHPRHTSDYPISGQPRALSCIMHQPDPWYEAELGETKMLRYGAL